ncbi:MAG: hypothetical protein LBS11_09860, partial [Oscillospiraceae bacterium]|nr:hypothetical protein [Oscillospiraceae bacterium]
LAATVSCRDVPILPPSLRRGKALPRATGETARHGSGTRGIGLTRGMVRNAHNRPAFRGD